MPLFARRRRPALVAALVAAAALVPAVDSSAADRRPLAASTTTSAAQDARHDHDHDHDGPGLEHAEAASSSSGSGELASGDGSADFAFLSRTDPPARWDACEHVDWKVALTGAPREGLDLVVEAVRKVEAVTGLRFRYQGETTFVPTRTQRTEAGVDLSVAWADADAPDVWTSTPAPAGAGGASWLGGHVDADGRAVPRIVSGFVTLEASAPRREDARLDALVATGQDVTAEAARVRAHRRQVVLHELGHALGLGHSTGSGQVMSPSASGVTEWASGDRAGLARLGASAGCLGGTAAEASARQVPLAPEVADLPPATTEVPTEAPSTASVPPAPAPAGPASAEPAPSAAQVAAPRSVPVTTTGPARVRRGWLAVLMVRGRPGDAYTVHARRAGTTVFTAVRWGRLDQTGTARVSFRPSVDHRWYATAGPDRTRSAVGLTQVVR